MGFTHRRQRSLAWCAAAAAEGFKRKARDAYCTVCMPEENYMLVHVITPAYEDITFSKDTNQKRKRGLLSTSALTHARHPLCKPRALLDELCKFGVALTQSPPDWACCPPRDMLQAPACATLTYGSLRLQRGGCDMQHQKRHRTAFQEE